MASDSDRISELSKPGTIDVPEETETVCHEKPRKKIILWIFAGIILAAVLTGVYFKTKKTPPLPDTIKGPVLELSHRVLDFGLQSLNTITKKELSLENMGTAPLTIEKISLKDGFPDPFKFPALNFPQNIPVNGKLMIPVSFVPGTGEIFTAELEIINNGENGSDTGNRQGKGRTGCPQKALSGCALCEIHYSRAS